MRSIPGLLSALLAMSAALAGLVYVCRGIAVRNRRDDPTVRAIAAGGLLFGALVAAGNVAFVFAGTIDGAGSDTYSGRQVFELELSLTGSYVLLVGLSIGAYRLIRSRPER